MCLCLLWGGGWGGGGLFFVNFFRLSSEISLLFAQSPAIVVLSSANNRFENPSDQVRPNVKKKQLVVEEELGNNLKDNKKKNKKN